MKVSVFAWATITGFVPMLAMALINYGLTPSPVPLVLPWLAYLFGMHIFLTCIVRSVSTHDMVKRYPRVLKYVASASVAVMAVMDMAVVGVLHWDHFLEAVVFITFTQLMPLAVLFGYCIKEVRCSLTWSGS